MAAQKYVYAKPELCMGCKICANACALAHWGVNNPRLSGIKIRLNPFAGFEYQEICRHCEEPAFLDACFTRSIVKDYDTGIVKHNPETCIGCWMCVSACPYDAINRDLVNQVAIKCDQCMELSEPVCARVCPTGAISYAEREK